MEKKTPPSGRTSQLVFLRKPYRIKSSSRPTITGSVLIQHFSDHFLILRMILLCLLLKEIDARFLKSHRHFSRLRLNNKLTRRRQKISDLGQLTYRHLPITSRFHSISYLLSNTLLQRSGFFHADKQIERSKPCHPPYRYSKTAPLSRCVFRSQIPSSSDQERLCLLFQNQRHVWQR